MCVGDFERLLVRHRVTVRKDGDSIEWEVPSGAGIGYEERLELDEKVPSLAARMDSLGLTELQPWIIRFFGGPADGKETWSPVLPHGIFSRISMILNSK